MDLAQNPLFRLMDARMSFLGQRESVLAENVANADMPNRPARDLRHVDFIAALSREARRLSPALTQPQHLGPVRTVSRFAVDADRRPYETKPDRNGIVLEEQMMKVADTQLAFQTTASLYQKYLGMLKTAASFRA